MKPQEALFEVFISTSFERSKEKVRLILRKREKGRKSALKLLRLRFRCRFNGSKLAFSLDERNLLKPKWKYGGRRWFEANVISEGNS
ncbi:MAG: hypothetical protein ACTS4V_01915 [Candidatus Hodgkinia cicadicola]